MKSSLLLSIVAVPSLALAVWACGGKEDTSSTQEGQTKGGQTAGQPDPAKTGSGESNGAQAPSGSTSTAPDCVSSNQSGSGGSGGPDGTYSCTTTYEYQCSTGDRSITCDCSGKGGSWGPGTCTCSDTGVTFAYDCANACSPTAAEFAKCNLPPPPADPGGGGQGSTSSSSGGP